MWDTSDGESRKADGWIKGLAAPPDTSSIGSVLNRLQRRFPLREELHPIEGGHFLAALDNMPEEFKMPFVSIEGDVVVRLLDAMNGASGTPSAEAPAPPKKNKVKYSCPTCQTNIWGKPNINVICADCQDQFVEQ